MQTLESILKLNVPKKEVDLNGAKIGLRIISNREMEDSWDEVRYFDDSTKNIAIKPRILARAIYSINGEDYKYKPTEEERKTLTIEEMDKKLVEEKLNVLNSAPVQTIASIFDEYTAMASDYTKTVDSVKKKLKNPKADTTGSLLKE